MADKIGSQNVHFDFTAKSKDKTGKRSDLTDATPLDLNSLLTSKVADSVKKKQISVPKKKKI